MRVLLASPHKGKGGITRWTEHILNYYHVVHQDGLELDLLPMDRHPFSNIMTRLLYGIWEYLKIIINEWSMLRKGHYDVLHLCTSADISLVKDIIMLGVGKFYHVRTILHFHFGRIPSIYKEKGWEWWLLCKTIRYVDVAVPIDEKSRQVLISAGVKNVVYIPNPLSPFVTNFVKEHEHIIQRDESMILFVGNCLKSKGIYELVEACKNIMGIHLVLVGYIEDSTKRELIQISGGDGLEILGQKSYEEILLRMMRCGIFVLPSYTEGFPNVILESMACGCAIIATTVGAIPEMIGDENGERCGLLIPPGDVEAVKNAICQFMNEKELMNKCRLNARHRVNIYSMYSVWPNLLRIWGISTKNSHLCR